MTLPSSFPISLVQVGGEVVSNINFRPQSISSPLLIALAQKTSLPVKMSDFLGKTGHLSFSALVVQDGAFNFHISVPSLQFFDSQVFEITESSGGGAQVVMDAISVPTYFKGPVQVKNTTRGISAVLNWNSGTGTWSASNVTIGLTSHAGETDSFTVYPA